MNTTTDTPGRQAPDGQTHTSIHATAVAVKDRALLITGASGTGKSRTAAQMLALGAGLIADDLVVAQATPTGVHVCAPPNTLAFIEMRGIGLVPVPLVARPIALSTVIELAIDRDQWPARLPQTRSVCILGVEVPHLAMPFAEDLGARLMVLMDGGQGSRPCGDPLPGKPPIP